MDQGLVAPPDDPNRYFDQDNKKRRKPARPEELAASWLRSHGIEVRSVDHVPTGAAAVRRPDAVIDALRRTIEIKTITGKSPRTVEEAIRRSSGQSDTILIDARDAMLDIAVIEIGIRNAIRKKGVSIAEVIVLVFDSYHVAWLHG